MRHLMDNLGAVFAAGAFGGLISSIAFWLAGRYGITQAMNVALAPELTPAWLYPRIVWGGIWGALFLLPLSRPRLFWRALLYSLVPSAAILFWWYPQQTPHGLLGLGLGNLTPVVIHLVYVIWALAAALVLRRMGRA